MKILGYVMAVIVGYIVGYLITVWVMSRIASANGDYIDVDEREEIANVCLIWPIILPFAILILVGYFVKAVADKIMNVTNDHGKD